MARRLQPDVVVMDLSLPELNGLDATRQILRDSPRSEILVLTMHHSEELARDVLQAGEWRVGCDRHRHDESILRVSPRESGECLVDLLKRRRTEKDEG